MQKEEEKREDIKVYEIESIDSDMFDRQKRIIGWDQKKILYFPYIFIEILYKRLMF